MIYITHTISLDEQEIQFRFVRASGPGGQNVNKVSTAVELRLDIRHSPSLPDELKQGLISLAGQRLSNEGVLLIDAHRFRTQAMNRKDALARLIALLQQAALPPIPRKATKPTRAARERRLTSKRRQSQLKQTRRGPIE